MIQIVMMVWLSGGNGEQDTACGLRGAAGASRVVAADIKKCRNEIVSQ